MASPTVSRNLNIYIDNTQAQKALDQLTTKAAKLETNIKQVEAAGGDATKEMQKLGQVNGQIKTLSDSLDKGLNKSLRDMQNELKSVEAQMKRATDPADIQRLQGVWKSLKDQTTQYQQALFKVKDAQSGLKAAFGSIGSTLKGTFLFGGLAGAAAAATSAILNAVRESEELAKQAVGVKIAFNRLNDPNLLDNLRKATRGTVTDLELMKRAVSANNFKIPLSELGTYLQFAQQRARDTGQSVDYLVDSIITGIGRKSPLILDNLGISASDLRDEMKKTGDMAKAVSNIISKSLQQTGQSGLTSADVLDQAAVKSQNAMAKIGRTFLLLKASYLSYLDGDYENSSKFFADMFRSQEDSQEKRINSNRNFIEEFKTADDKSRGELLVNLDSYLSAAEKAEERYRTQGNIAFQQYYASIITNLKNLRDEADKINIAGPSLSQLQDQLKTAQQNQLAATSTAEYKQYQKVIDQIQADIDKITGKQSEASQKILNDRKKLVEDLKRIEDELTHYFDNEIQKRVHAIELKYAKEAELAHGNAVLLERIERDKNEELLFLQQDYLQKAADAMEKSKTKFTVNYSELYNEINGTSKGKELLNIQKSDVAKGLQQVVGKLGSGTSDDLKKSTDGILKTFQKIEEVANDALNVYQNFDQILQQQEQNELQRDQEIHDKKIKLLQSELNSKLITQQEFNQKSQKLDDDLTKKKHAIEVKEFKRQKQIQAVQTLMAGARAAVEAYATLGPIGGAIAATAIGIVTAAEVAMIEKQKPPSLGKGGSLKGPKHDSPSNGMPVLNPITGEAQAYVEGGEGILMARAMDDRRIYRVMGTPSQIASRLNSEHGGVNWESGASLQPIWVNNPYSIDVPRILNTYSQSRTFGRGGRFESADSSKGQEEDTSLNLLKEQNSLLQKQVQLLSMPTRSYVVLSDLNQQQQRLAAIQSDATMR